MSTLRRAAAQVSENRRLLANAGSMIGAAAVTSTLGAAFWLLAARELPASAVGVGAAAVSAITLIGFVAALGLGTLLMGELPRHRGRGPLVAAALVVSGATGCALGAAFALGAPLVSPALEPLRSGPAATALFAGGSGLAAVGLVLDQALIGLLRGGLQLARNALFAVVKLAALAAVLLGVAEAGAEWIWFTWAAGIAASLVVCARLRRRGERLAVRPDLGRLLAMRRAAASHAAVNLGLETADLAMPVIVVALVSASANAGFYVAWMLVGILVMVPQALTMVAYAIGSADPAGLPERLRFTFAVSLAFAAVSGVAMLALAAPVLELFGAQYARETTTGLQIMAFGVLPLAIKVHYVAIRRVERRLRRALPLVWAGTALELGGGALGGALGGVNGVAIGWLVGLAVEAIAMAPTVRRALALPRPARAGRAPPADLEPLGVGEGVA